MCYGPRSMRAITALMVLTFTLALAPEPVHLAAVERPMPLTGDIQLNPHSPALTASLILWTTAKADMTMRWYEHYTPHSRLLIHHTVSTRHTVTGRSSNSIESCIIARENGGSYSRSSNPNHFGRYQFDRQTWVTNGGDPSTWGSASPQEQDAVFHATVSRYGYTPWRQYDGC